MEKDIYKRFDELMAELRPIEPSENLGAGFRRKFSEAVSQRRKKRAILEGLSRLEPIKPSPAFDLQFREKLDRAITEKHRETVFDSFSRKAVMALNYYIMPRTPVLVKVVAGIMLFLTIGFGIYSRQPSSLLLAHKDGIVLAKNTGDYEWRKVVPETKFTVGDTIATRQGAELDIILKDKYAIRLKGSTEIRIAKLTPKYGKGKAVFELVQGTVLINIDDGFKGSRFIVDTATAEAKALGTKFSVSFSKNKNALTNISVLEGKVEVKSRFEPGKDLIAKRSVLVGSGQKTRVETGKIPSTPQRMIEEEWLILEELYQIGRKLKVVLLIKNTPERVMQLLKPCPIYISDEKPREIPTILEEALYKLNEAVRTKSKIRHLESIKMFEKIVEEYPNPKYDVQFLLYIGAYYKYLGLNEDALRTFRKIVVKYPDAPLTSIAQCAIGVLYEKKFRDWTRAYKAYKVVLKRYPNSLEAIWVENKLGVKT